MLGSRSRDKEAFWAIAAVARFLCGLATSVFATAAVAGTCSYFELPRIQGEQLPYVYEAEEFPWSVTVDELEGAITITNKKSKAMCETNITSVRRVYGGGPNRIAFRSIEIASDDLFFLDPRSCKSTRKAKHLGVHAGRDTEKVLRSLGVCGLKK
jgi:hypothetical protein